MVQNQKFKGFTLLELIVAMAIIAVLIGLSLLGIQTVQRSSRDTQRRSTLEAINLEITDYYGNKNTYPALAVIRTGNPQTMRVGPAGAKTVALQGAAVPLTAGTQVSTSAGSAYCYVAASPGNAYILGVNLESGTTFTLGTITTVANCSTWL